LGIDPTSPSNPTQPEFLQPKRAPRGKGARAPPVCGFAKHWADRPIPLITKFSVTFLRKRFWGFLEQIENMHAALNEAKCPNCGGLLPEGGLKGLCPACLLAAGRESVSGERRGQQRFEPPSVETLSRLFPQLQVLRLLGAGGMGAVYQARQPALDRLVALKVLPPGSSHGASFPERFTREARALARLNHPNIVAVHEFGQAEALPYFIMEYVDGANLRQLEETGRLSPREALQIIPQICDALQYAHDEGVVHRDIKPENVLVDRKGRVKIADFGLAKILGIEADQARLTVDGQVMGTPHYMAPEQVERPLAVDHRADIYSLGVVFYEMLTGDLPIGKFAPPSRKASLDVRLDEVVLRALENDPARRYQRASEVKSEVVTISENKSCGPASLAPRSLSGRPVERVVYWAGIPLVADRDGEREILWNGGLAAVGTGFVLTSVGLALFHWITGLPTPAIAGIPALVTLAILGVGFRWALNTPLPAEPAPRVAPKGTVVLSPPRRRLGWSLLALGSLVPAMFAWGFLLNHGLPALKDRFFRNGIEQTAELDPSTGVLAVELPGGGKAEVLAIGFRDPAPNQWWRPDGRLITNELWQIENLGEASSSTTTNRDLIFRLVNLPPGADFPSFEIRPGGGFCSGGEVVEGTNSINGACGLRLGVSPALNRIDLRMGFPLQAWRTISIHDPKTHSLRSESRPGDPRWDVVFNKASETSEGAQLTMVMGPENREWVRRIVAIDTNQVEHGYLEAAGTPTPDSMTWTYTFKGLSLSNVQDFRVQVRPLHWVEFPRLRLYPKRALPAPNRVLFGLERQVTFSDFIDFDSGKVQEPPAGTTGNVFAGMAETVAWMERSGFDAAAGNGELQPLGMVFVGLENGQWDSLSPTELTTRLHQGMFKPTVLKPWKNGELPSTFGFRTREGGTGILQLLAFEKERPGATLRFKLLQRPVFARQ
jgi:predicted Ser/Thr protein kinase